MIDGLKVLALIPARGGSKGIKNKNIVLLNGKPLISYSICEALKSKYIDDVVVTTDSEDIAGISRLYGAKVPFMRPHSLGGDKTTTIEVVLHAITALRSIGNEYDIMILLQPTQPLRTYKDIDASIDKFLDDKMKPLASISEVDDHPILVRSINEKGEMKRLLDVCSTCRRQDMPKYYRINGCIYINRVSELNENTTNTAMGAYINKSTRPR